MKKAKKETSFRARPKKFLVATAQSKIQEYEKDFSKWALTQAALLKKGEFSKLDIEHLIEEIQDLSKREKQRLTSHLEILLMHMLKVKFQPSKQSTSWELSIKDANFKAQTVLEENPSLKPKLKEIVEKAYFSARIQAALETKLKEKIFPEVCPWSLKELFPDLEKKYLK